MKRKILSIALVCALCLSFAACAVTGDTSGNAASGETSGTEEEELIGLANPVTVVESFEALQEAEPDILINDAPEGAEDVTYSWINNLPAISQISFTLDSVHYTYRAAVCGTNAPTVDISGVFSLENMAATTGIVGGENALCGSYIVRYNGETGEGIANWNTPDTLCQYSLYTDTGCKDDMSALKGVMEELFIYKADAATVSGTVLDKEENALVVTLDEGITVTFETDGMVVTVNANDRVDVLYRGDLNGSAQALKITGTGAVETGVVYGTVTYVDVAGETMNLITADNNIYVFDISKAEITGLVSVVTENLNVTVTYAGDLHDLTNLPAAQTIHVLEIIPDPTATPTPAPSFVNRSQTGICTSWENIGSSIHVTVNGIQFTAKNATITGTPAVGSQVTVRYKDYGNWNHVVTNVEFAGAPTPTPAPSYTDTSVSGTVDYANGIWIGVNGMDFTVNSANCYVDGTAEVGGWATINYRDYGYGVYEVTSAYFSPATYQVEGNVDDFNQRGNNITVNGVEYYFTNSTSYNQTPYAGMHASMIVNSSNEVLSGTFTGGIPEPQGPETIIGTVEDWNERGNNFTVNGVEYIIGSSTSVYGTPAVGVTATMVVNNGELQSVTFG